MRLFKLKIVVGLALFITTLLGSCTTANHEVVVEFDMSRVILLRARNSKNADFSKVYNAALESYSKNKGNYIDIFFKKADAFFPGRKYMTFFKSNPKLAINASNKEVKKYFDGRREKLGERIIAILSSRLERFGVASAEIAEGKDLVMIGINKSGNEKIIAKLVMSSVKIEFLEVYDQYEIQKYWGELLELSGPRLELAADSTYTENQLYTILSASNPYSRSNANSENNLGGQVAFNGVDQQIRVRSQDKRIVTTFLDSKEVKEKLPKNLSFKWSMDPEKDNSGKSSWLCLVSM